MTFNFYFHKMTLRQQIYYEDYVRKTIDRYLVIIDEVGLEVINRNLKSLVFFNRALKELGISYEQNIYPYIRQENERICKKMLTMC